MCSRPLARLLAATLLLLSLPVASFARKASLDDSIQPLQSMGKTFCTAWSINAVQGLWATAKHCAEPVRETGMAVTIGPISWAYVVYMAPHDDVAVFQSSLHAPALFLAHYPAAVGDALWVHGYPYGLFRLITTRGIMAARMEPTENGVSDITDVTVAPGNSGSPVLAANGYVVGLVWGKFDKSDHALTVPLETLKRTLGAYVQEG